MLSGLKKEKKELLNLVEAKQTRSTETNKLEIMKKMVFDILKNAVVVVDDKKIDLTSYRKNNVRVICSEMKDDGKSVHCKGNKLVVPKTQYKKFIERLVFELSYDLLRRDEVFQVHGKYLDKIIDYNVFSLRKGYTITAENEYISNAVLNLDQMDRDFMYTTLNKDNQMKHYRSFLIQNVNMEEYGIFRAYANGYYYLHFPEEKLEYKNLGYVNPVQTKMAKIFRAKVIIDMPNMPDKYFDDLNKIMGEEIIPARYIKKMFRDDDDVGDIIPELTVLSYVYPKYPIYIYDNSYVIDFAMVGGGSLETIYQRGRRMRRRMGTSVI